MMVLTKRTTTTKKSSNMSWILATWTMLSMPDKWVRIVHIAIEVSSEDFHKLGLCVWSCRKKKPWMEHSRDWLGFCRTMRTLNDRQFLRNFPLFPHQLLVLFEYCKHSCRVWKFYPLCSFSASSSWLFSFLIGILLWASTKICPLFYRFVSQLLQNPTKLKKIIIKTKS